MLDPDTLHRRARRVLPDKIETREVVIDAVDENRLAALLLPLRHRHRGAILFRLAPATLAALASRSLSFLQDARRAREGLGRRSAPLAYGAWTRVSDGNAACFRTASRDGRASLTLVPVAGLAVYAWDDHRIGGSGRVPSWR